MVAKITYAFWPPSFHANLSAATMLVRSASSPGQSSGGASGPLGRRPERPLAGPHPNKLAD